MAKVDAPLPAGVVPPAGPVDAAATHELGAGLEHTAVDANTANSPAHHRATSDGNVQKQKAVIDGARAPVGGVKGAAHEAAVALLQQRAAAHVERALDGKLSEPGRAMKAALREPLRKVSLEVATELSRTGAHKAVGQALRAGDKVALSAAAGKVAGDVANALNVSVDPAAVQGLVNVTAGAATRLAALAGEGTAVAKAATQLAGAAVSVGSKVTGGAVAAVEAGGRFAPGAGQVLAFAAALSAAAEVWGHLRHKGPDGKRDGWRVAAAVGNFVGQAVGVVVPMVGGAAMTAKIAADAALNARDDKAGLKPAPTVGLKDASQVLSSATSVMEPLLQGMGQDDMLSTLRKASSTVAELSELTPAALAKLSHEQRAALEQVVGATKSEVEAVSAEHTAPDDPAKAALYLAGETLQSLWTALRKAKNIDRADKPEEATAKATADVTEAAGKAAATLAVVEQHVPGTIPPDAAA